jgi:hypothetical protein
MPGGRHFVRFELCAELASFPRIISVPDDEGGWRPQGARPAGQVLDAVK